MPPAQLMIVDDQSTFRTAARELLQARGYEVVAEADGLAAALEALERHTPDAALVDVRLGAESGFDVAWALTDARPELRVLLVSGDELDHPARVSACRACGFVLKRRLLDIDFDAFW